MDYIKIKIYYEFQIFNLILKIKKFPCLTLNQVPKFNMNITFLI
jgi:hypothetical protein